mmetsp:Transcript_17415/g.19652  ORF Transcript_17415/g.19652 Transcript_17415/m.19652 type:complete len:245 (+) Transcript_17415:1-735(+)
MDMTYIMIIVLFLAKVYTMRPLIALIILFLVRALIQRMFQMRQPDGHYWDYPGFPSLTVPYVADRNNFFYSGHVGTAVVVALQYRQEKFYSISYVIGFVAVFEGFTLIVLRDHYTVDVVVAAFFAHLFCTFATFLAPFIDPYIFKPTDDSPSRHNPSLIGMTSYHTKEIQQNQVQGLDQAKIHEYRDEKRWFLMETWLLNLESLTFVLFSPNSLCNKSWQKLVKFCFSLREAYLVPPLIYLLSV